MVQRDTGSALVLATYRYIAGGNQIKSAGAVKQDGIRDDAADLANLRTAVVSRAEVVFA